MLLLLLELQVTELLREGENEERVNDFPLLSFSLPPIVCSSQPVPSQLFTCGFQPNVYNTSVIYESRAHLSYLKEVKQLHVQVFIHPDGKIS